MIFFGKRKVVKFLGFNFKRIFRFNSLKDSRNFSTHAKLSRFTYFSHFLKYHPAILPSIINRIAVYAVNVLFSHSVMWVDPSRKVLFSSLEVVVNVIEIF